MLSPGGHATLTNADLMARRPRGGTISGPLTDATRGSGMGGVDVSLAGTRWRAATGADGRYRLVDITLGSHTLLVRRIGHGQDRRAVTIRAVQDATVDVILQARPTVLDEVIVTGTLIPTEVKALP